MRHRRILRLRRKPFEYPVNRKRIQRLMHKMGLLRPVKRRKVCTTDSQHPYLRYPNLVKDLQIAYPDQVWVSDITYIRLADGGYAPLNPPEWIERWGPQVVLLSVAAGGAEGRPDCRRPSGPSPRVVPG